MRTHPYKPFDDDEVLLRRSAVEQVTTLSRSTLYRLMARGEFPKPVAISPNRIAWRVADVHDWLVHRHATPSCNLITLSRGKSASSSNPDGCS